ncbi:hypothetical protein QQ045_023110 [Rhodiola kirilowii]
MEGTLLASLQAAASPIFVFFLTLLLLKWYLYLHFKDYPSSKQSQPPSPPRVPILGNLHQVGLYPHRSFESLAKRYGPLMLFHWGRAPVFIVSSAKVAEDILKTHDLGFSNRLESIISRKVMYDTNDLIMARHGEYWKLVRGLCATQLMSSARVQSQQRVRDEETTLMVERIKRFESSPFNLNTEIQKVSIDVMCRAAFGRKVDEEEATNQRQFDKILKELNGLLGVFNIEEYVPWLGWINYFNGLNMRIERGCHDIDQFLEKIVNGQLEREHDHHGRIGVEKLLLDVLLDAQNDDGSKITRASVKGILLDMFGGGIDSTYAAMEWTMTELLRHPEMLEKVLREVREIVGDKKQISIHDLNKMSYLKASIKEALRLHPPFPVIPRVSGAEAVDVQGYTIPPKTRILINIWAIGRDSASWVNPNEFKPERFLLDSDQVYGLNWMPFGGGRRGCPGVSFGTVLVEHVLACLLLNFNWSLPEGATSADINIDEFVTMVLHRMHPLVVVATPHNNS